LGGTVEAHSELGKGSIFSLLIPVGIGTASLSSLDREIGVQANEGKSSPRDEGPWPILLVEDQESNRTVIRLMLKAMGYDVETAVDGQEAVEMAFSKTYCLIIMDLKMPRMDGYEAASCLREKKLMSPLWRSRPVAQA
jgi:PleD family two-component response regulator